MSDDISLCFHVNIKINCRCQCGSHPRFPANYSLSPGCQPLQLQRRKQMDCLSSRTASAKQGSGQRAHSHAPLGPKRERTRCRQPTGQAQSPRLCKPRGVFNTLHRSPAAPRERGLKSPLSPAAGDPPPSSAGRAQPPAAAEKQEALGGIPAPVSPPSGSIWSLGPLHRRAHPQLRRACIQRGPERPYSLQKAQTRHLLGSRP